MNSNILKYFVGYMFLIFGNDTGSSAKKSKGDALNESFRNIVAANLSFPRV